MKTISLDSFKDNVEVEIDGHKYIVRRMGSNEELDLSISMRQASDVLDMVSRLQAQFLKMQVQKEEDIDKKQLDSLIKKMNKATKELEDLQRYQFEAYVKLFDDGDGGSKSREMLSSLPSANIKKLIEDIFTADSVLNDEKEEANDQSA